MLPVIDSALKNLNSVILGKPVQVRLALTCLLAGGHLLIEDLPGMGKTTLAQALARVLGLSYGRVQFTSDLLPGDILGVSIFNPAEGSFRFHEGPVFAQVVLADEINRATPKTQSALLEAMEERQVTVDGVTRPLPLPFFVIATQNPFTQLGTYPLPESQLDRFMMRISLGYPGAEMERNLLRGEDRRQVLERLPVASSGEKLLALQQEVQKVRVSDALIDYVQRLVAHTRGGREYAQGLSPRAGLSLLAASRAHAFVHDRDHVLPDDVQAVFASVVEHRLRGAAEGAGDTQAGERILRQVALING